MSYKFSNAAFLILFFLLQSCSGGKIGNFLESSFNNTNKISQKDIDKKSESSIIPKDKNLVNKRDEITKIKLNDDMKSINIVNSFPNNTNDENKIKKRNQEFNPKSYRVFVILKKVDPSFRTENFSKILRSGDINFEIEKIELMPEFNQDKK